MKIIEPSIEILNPPSYQDMLKHIEIAGRTCYKSEDKINEGSAEELIKRLIKNGHHSVLEHCSISVRFICDRGVSHELVRHRLCSFSQESTRYCNYSGNKFGKELTFIRPVFWPAGIDKYKQWEAMMRMLQDKYINLIADGSSPQEARSVLPNSLKTEIVVSANIRQWRTIFNQRCVPAAHPQMIQVMAPTLLLFVTEYPVFFEDQNYLWEVAEKYFVKKGWKMAEVKNG